jgi:hypothetical protein
LIDYQKLRKEVLARMLEGRDLSDQKAKDARVAWHSDLRLDALGDVFAAEADNDPGVVRFRSEVLRGKLLRREKVWPWIERQTADADNAVQGTEIDSSYPASILLPEGSLFAPREGSALGRLSRICQNLTIRYGWSDDAAREFLLCGIAPRLGATYEVEYGSKLEWIRLRVPVTFGAGDVGDMYAQARREAWGELGIDRTRSRTRRIDAQTAERAVFAARNNTGATWREALEVWNTEHPEPFPGDWRAFQNALARSYQQVTWQKLAWVGAGVSQSVSEPGTPASRPEQGKG